MTSRLIPSIRSLLFSVVVITIVTCTLHREVLFEGAIYHMDDAADNYYPARVAFRRALSDGTLPSWENGTMAGWPLLADPYYGYFYPLNVVFYLGARTGEPPTGDAAGVPSGLGYSAALHMWLGGLGMLWLLRRRVSWAAALFGALAFALSSFQVVRIRHIIFVQAVAWLPWLLWAIEHYLQTKQRRSLAAAALCSGLVLLAGAHSLLHFLLLPVVVYTLGRLLSFALAEASGQKLRYFFVQMAWLAVAALAGALLGSIALFPTLLQMPLTGRALGTDYYFASTYAWPEMKYWHTLLMPDLFGRGEWRGEPWVGKWNHWEIAGYYQGVAAFLLSLPGAVLGVFDRLDCVEGQPESQVNRPISIEKPLLLVVSLCALVIALGDGGPLHPFLFRYFPLYAALRCPSRALSILVLTVPILGSFGADRLLRGPRAESWRRLVLGIFAAAAVVAAGVLYRAQLLRLLGTLPIAMQLATVAKAHAALVVAGLGAVLTLRFVGRAAGPEVMLLLAVLTIADQHRLDRGYLHPQPVDYAYGTERFAAVNWLLANQVPATQPPTSAPIQGPSSGPPLYDRFVSDPRGPFRLLALGETIGRPSASGYGSIQLWRYSHLLYILNHGETYPHRRLKEDLAAAMLWRLDSPIVDMLNVRYLIGPSSPGSRWVERFRPALGMRPQARYEAWWDPQLAVFENLQVMPRTYVAYQARLAKTQAEEAMLVARPEFDPHREIVLGQPFTKSSPTSTLVPAIENQGRAHSPARIETYQRHRVVLSAEAIAPGMLVLADTYHPDWQVLVDGQPQALFPVNLALRGVALSPGHHVIEMRYRDRGLRLGAILSLIGLLGVVALLIHGARKDREMVHV